MTARSIYAAIVAAVVGALWGSSSHLHTGPTNAASLLVLSSLVVVALPGSPEFIAAAGLMGLARLGILVNFVSMSVVVGFTAGAGVLIAANQIRHLARLDFPSSADFIPTISETARHLPEAHGPSLAIGIGAMILILLVWRIRPAWPATLIGMMAAAIAVGALRLHETGGVIVLGELPRGSLRPLRWLRALTQWPQRHPQCHQRFSDPSSPAPRRRRTSN